MSIKDNILEIEAQIENACKRVGRSKDEVQLIAVTKLHTPAEINEALDAGITDIAENKVQEILNKYEDVGEARWHLIGHLQTNKVKYIVDKVVMIHSVDSLKLAKEIDKRSSAIGRTMDILIQVNSAEEESKFGIKSTEVDSLIDDIVNECKSVRIKGLMCIAPFEEDLNDCRPYFAEVKDIFDRYKGDEREAVDFEFLSMGMSGDFEVAIEEGSNMVRVGTAIFGVRNYRQEEK
ncbi:MAG: YggS family pyridoxal phosphate-dependent enzyme [[Eubacterium] sulci]|nr:YggS family pyridoxal phosphate-dependent enzyme [[Eubacterium] sulci]MBF1181235.1 YggS family pyridoxal phosphate-dependent enzyme [[Eubacterium] sulci]